MDIWHSLSGAIKVRLISADTTGLLNTLQQKGIVFHDLKSVDELTLEFGIARRQYSLLRRYGQTMGFQVQILKRQGLFWPLKLLLRRPVLVIGLVLVVILGLYLSDKVLFVYVEGNGAVPTNLILEEAADHGVAFGSNREQIRSEQVKNALLAQIPQLKWVGVNTYGCVAVISVTERKENTRTEPLPPVAGIVAGCDGVVTEVTASAGTPVCKPGQAVKAGQLLISGYTDCGLTIRAQCAKGEIYADTRHYLEVITPQRETVCTETGVLETKYSLIIGKKRINLYFGSGISDTGCVKMYEESYITLPGGFQLPVVIVRETWIQRDLQQQLIHEQAAAAQLSHFAQNYLISHMVAGRILVAEATMDVAPEVYRFCGSYQCNEMIGRLRSEEIVKPNGAHE